METQKSTNAVRDGNDNRAGIKCSLTDVQDVENDNKGKEISLLISVLYIVYIYFFLNQLQI